MSEEKAPIKQVIVMRKDLGMRQGKAIAQGGHAVMMFLTRRLASKEPITPVQQDWLDSSFRKICVVVNSEAELLDIAAKAQDAGVECHVVEDSGLTEFKGVVTKTCLALGPDYDEKINPLTGHLKLY